MSRQRWFSPSQLISFISPEQESTPASRSGEVKRKTGISNAARHLEISGARALCKRPGRISRTALLLRVSRRVRTDVCSLLCLSGHSPTGTKMGRGPKRYRSGSRTQFPASLGSQAPTACQPRDGGAGGFGCQPREARPFPSRDRQGAVRSTRFSVADSAPHYRRGEPISG